MESVLLDRIGVIFGAPASVVNTAWVFAWHYDLTLLPPC